MGLGTQLERAELFSADSEGNAFRRVDREQIGYSIMPVKETAPHALSHANTLTTEEHQEDERREREARSRFLELDDTDRAILRMHLQKVSREIVRTFPVKDRSDLEVKGWMFRKHTANGRRVEMVCSFILQPTHEDIGHRLGLSARTVLRRLSALDKALVMYAELRGWV